MKKIALLLIRAYRLFLSPFLGNNCKFTPTCSEYALEAIGKWGLIKGGLMALKRVLRCNPWTPGGKDPLK